MKVKHCILGICVLASLGVCVALFLAKSTQEDGAVGGREAERVAADMGNPKKENGSTAKPQKRQECAISNQVEQGASDIRIRDDDASFELALGQEDFERLLADLSNESLETRLAALRELNALSNREKICHLEICSRSDDEKLRLAAIKATRTFFGMDAFERKTGTTYRAAKARREEEGDADMTKSSNVMVDIDMSALPTKREAVEINSIVRRGMKDEDAAVRGQAVVTASYFDVDTCKTLYQYAMTSCGDDVRMAVLKDAEYGDDDFRLRLAMAALDGAGEVKEYAAGAVESATGRRFETSEEAFEWYEANKSTELELEFGETDE